MPLFRFAAAALALLACAASAHAQNVCKPGDPTGHFEGTATSQQAGKLDVSLNLRCDQGRYAGELVTPVGTYTVESGRFESGQLHLKLVAGPDSVNMEAASDSAGLHGKFSSGDDSGPFDLRRTGNARPPAVAEPASLTKEQWHEDRSFFARELPLRHANAFHFTSRQNFDAAVAALDARLDRLSYDEIYVAMDTIANSIGDGHTYIRFPADRANFPIDIERFGDDYRLIAAASGYESALGGRLIKIDDTPIARAHDLLFPLTAADETQALREGRVHGFLTIGIMLHGAGIIHDRNSARYTLARDDGTQFTLDVHAVPDSANLHWTYAYKEPPLFRQRPDDSFWSVYLPESRTVYCAFRGYKDLGSHSKALFEMIAKERPEKLVVDMRLNGGGDYFEGLKHMVHPIRDLPEINRKGHLFVLVGSGTFSAAMSNSAHFRYQTNAILVGQQIGEKPNSYQEAREMELPNSHWKVRYSVKFYKFVETGENLIRPDQEIIPTWDDYKSGRDPVLDWVLKYPAPATGSNP